MFNYIFACLTTLLTVLLVLAQEPEAPPVAKREVLYTPSSSVLFASQDIQQVYDIAKRNAGRFNLYDPKQVRYLSLYNIPEKDREVYQKILTFMMNSLSRNKALEPLRFVPGTDKTLLRVHLDYYGIDVKEWDKLGEKGSGPSPFPEPFFHIRVKKAAVKRVEEKVEYEYEEVPTGETKLEPTGRYYQGRPVYREVEVKVRKKKKIINNKVIKKKENDEGFELAQAPWVDQTAAAKLVEYTHTNFPIFRGDWFLTYVCVPPAYYNFLGIGEQEADFEKLLFADQKLAEKAKSQVKGTVNKSKVARNNRTLIRSPSFAGRYYWISHDVINNRAERDYLKNVLEKKFDAIEIVASLPNGLQAYWIGTDEGERQDEVPNNIALDYTNTDTVVRAGRSCITCHSTGVLEIKDEIRLRTRLFKTESSIAAINLKKEDYFKLRDLYDNDLSEVVKEDQDYFDKAVKRCNGLSSEENASLFLKIYNKYAETFLNFNDVSRETGLSRAELFSLLQLKDNDDIHILRLIKDRDKILRRHAWEESFQIFMLLVTAHKGGAP